MIPHPGGRRAPQGVNAIRYHSPEKGRLSPGLQLNVSETHIISQAQVTSVNSFKVALLTHNECVGFAASLLVVCV